MNNKELVLYVENARNAGWGYVWGTFGQVLTPDLLCQKLRQYPDGVGNYFDFIKSHWMGKRTVDCVGLIKSFYWTVNGQINYNGSTDVSADGMFDVAKEKGPINTMPDIPGICVGHPGHIGVYVGDGQVIEAHGTMYGVIKTPLNGPASTGWTKWCKCPYIDYETNIPIPKPPVIAPSKETRPTALLQIALNAGGFRDRNGNTLEVDADLGTHSNEALNKVALGPGSVNPVVGWAQGRLHISQDNIYGKPPTYHETYDAVGKQQTLKHLVVDHVIGINTLKSLL